MKFAHNSPGKSRGAALPYVLGLIILLGISLNILFRENNTQLQLTYKRKSQLQSNLLAESGLNFALSKYNSFSSKDSTLNFETSKLQYWIEPQKQGFEIFSELKGMFGYVESKSILSNNKSSDEITLTAWVGQEVNWEKFPAICLTNKQGNLVLAGNASIEGDVLLWQGNVRKATSRKVRFSGATGHRGNTLDSNSVLWNHISVYLNNINSWINNIDLNQIQNKYSSDNKNINSDISNTSDKFHLQQSNSESVDEEKTNFSEKEKTIVYEHQLIIKSGKLSFSSRANYINSEFYADTVFIEDGAKLKNCLVFAKTQINLSGNVNLSGQYIARDSIKIKGNLSQTSFPVFYVKGRIEVKDKDTSYVGGLMVEECSGNGIFIFAGENRRTVDSKEHIVIDHNSKIKGIVYAMGNVNFQGALSGSLVAENLRFQKEGTTYLGHLYNGKISFWKSEEIENKNAALIAPLLFSPKLKAVYFNKSRKEKKELSG